ncbi:Phosphatidylinositol 4-phosphate 5-kinase 8 [Babesia sp. Xinjiang]|uniref:Phosphatidylinositol 4-phosphate 5-kinase 8 n=1 Tax=Babesia sp. Xinjiang TaxID=462227 RepID=UPI000A24586E|nr:Phosphatidylinositol 4-phosphate 5-kinase 8 [Babesia sp. Xinjiang]ORM41307.1 Phosphatidylinositol 4-phosphate 5-kinase 8 [Babesia sp. Xinjiang]
MHIERRIMGNANGRIRCCHRRGSVGGSEVRHNDKSKQVGAVPKGARNVNTVATKTVESEPKGPPPRDRQSSSHSVSALVSTGFVEPKFEGWDDKVLASLLGGQPTKLENVVGTDIGNGMVERGPVLLPDGSVYCGQWRGDIRHGLGKHFAMDGTRYVGSFDSNLYDGTGELTYVNGDNFKGIFKAGLRNGKGVMLYANGDTFDGTWRNGLRHGFGVERFADGSVYMGMFKDNRRDGNGELKMSNGVVYEGMFDNDVTGQGRMVWPTGESYMGEFRHGFKHNYGMTTYRSGPVVSEKGTYNMGRMDGVFECVMRDGHTFLRIYKNGELVKDITNNKNAVKRMKSVHVNGISGGGLVLVDEEVNKNGARSHI